MTINETDVTPDDLKRLFVARANAGDAAGMAALYEPEAVMAYPPGEVTVGRDAIRALWEQVLAKAPAAFEPEAPLPTLVSGDIALTSTIARDGTGVRAQVARRPGRRAAGAPRLGRGPGAAAPRPARDRPAGAAVNRPAAAKDLNAETLRG